MLQQKSVCLQYLIRENVLPSKIVSLIKLCKYKLIGHVHFNQICEIRNKGILKHLENIQHISLYYADYTGGKWG